MLTRTENRGEAAHFAGAGACKHTRCVCSAASSNYEYAGWYAAGSHCALHCPLYRSTGMCVCACVCTCMFACMCVCECACASVVSHACASVVSHACASVVYHVCASVVYCLFDLLRGLRSSTLPPPHPTHTYQIPLLVSELALLEHRATLACQGRGRWGGTVKATQPPSPQPLAALESAETETEAEAEAEAELMSAQAGRRVEGDDVPRSHVARTIRPQPTRAQLSNDDAARAQVAQEAKQLAAACTQRGFTSLSQPLLKVADGSCSWCVVRLSFCCPTTCCLLCL